MEYNMTQGRGPGFAPEAAPSAPIERSITMDSSATRAQLALPLLPDLPGKVHGIVSLDPPTVQCDGCGYTFSHPHLAIAVMCGGIEFNPRRPSDGRLCRTCRSAATS